MLQRSTAHLASTVVPGNGSVAWQREVLGVCVPYRTRRDQLEVFASHMRTFLHGQGVPFRIYVGEQAAPGAFNRGWALNVAFTFAEADVDYVVRRRRRWMERRPPCAATLCSS
jgi:hypothetical protein